MDITVETFNDEQSESFEDNQNHLALNSVSSIISTTDNKPTVPVFGNISVSKSENVHFGNNTYFNGPVVIKQLVQTNPGLDNNAYVKTDEETKKFAESHNLSKTGSDSKSPKKCAIQLWHKITAVLCCTIAIIIICLLSVYVMRGSSTDNGFITDFDGVMKTNDSLLRSPNHLRIVPRTDWLAQPVDKPLDLLELPVPWVIITHTATESCSTQSECVLRVRLVQMFHVESRGWYDIGYNFLVGGDGSVYVGRGWDYVGAHTKGYNKYSVSIALIGTFNNEAPTQRQVDACIKLIQLGVSLGKVAKDYKLLAHRQLMSTLSPGDRVYNIISQWPHFVSNITDITEILPH